MIRRLLWFAPLVLCVLVISLLFGSASAAEPAAPIATPTPAVRVHLPLVLKPSGSVCPTSSSNSYSQGTAYQFDRDNPVRPAAAHADKNFTLRGYVVNTDSWLRRELVNYGTDDPTQPPQFATLFSPNRVPPLVGFYRVHDWNWSPSPAPGSPRRATDAVAGDGVGIAGVARRRCFVCRHPPTTSARATRSSSCMPMSDEWRSAITREDSAGAAGYTVHVEGLCTDPKLLALYNQLNAANGPRYVYPNGQYPLPVLPAGKPIGVARGSEVVVAVVDSGTFMDPRSCNEWWQIRPGYTGTCPQHELSALSD